jgi:hypothetical protein
MSISVVISNLEDCLGFILPIERRRWFYEKNGTWGKNQDPIAADVWSSDLSDDSTEILK